MTTDDTHDSEIARLRSVAMRLCDFVFDEAKYPLAYGGKFRELVCALQLAALPAHSVEPVDGTCCSCGYDGEDETPCTRRADHTHCEHWWDGTDEEIASQTSVNDGKEKVLDRKMADLCDEVEALFAERFPGRAAEVLTACLLITGRQAGSHTTMPYEEFEEHCCVLLHEGWHFGRQGATS